MSDTDQSLPVSSPGCPVIRKIAKKPIKPPTVTPRRFNRFFAIAPTSEIHQNVRTSRRALQAITNPPGQPKNPPHSSKLIGQDHDQENKPPSAREARGNKRKLSFASVVSPLLVSPLRPDTFFLPSSQDNPGSSVCSRRCSLEPSGFEQAEADHESVAEDEDEDEDEDKDAKLTNHGKRDAIRPYSTLSRSSNILSSRLSGRSRRQEPKSSKIWQYEAASFYSNAKDTYFCGRSQASGHPTLPFCSAGCNTNSLVAIGDEEGSIRLLDSASDTADGFTKTYLTFKPHDNAIMNLDFSEDDRLLATGSGDQTCRIIDMLTQETLHTLAGHSSSVKQVKFQPESKNSIVASCGRDGNVNIWDLRTRSVDRPAQSQCCISDTGVVCPQNGFNMPAVSLRDSIRAAHSDRDRSRKATFPKSRSKRREEASVTSLLFLGAGREHLLATASAADATVKLWDMRTTYDTRRARPLPLSTTRQPASHETHRDFALTSMVLSSDGARVYTLCKDHTIYAYSTPHLILGHAPELSNESVRPRWAGGAEREGLGPLYGFRHQQLQVSSFYVKLSVRKQKDDQTEFLAAGSSNDCAVLFPTNERYLGCHPSSRPTQDPGHQGLRRRECGSEIGQYLDDDIPIYQHGTALVRGHQKEVTAVSWTNEGRLVTVSDDFHVRCWQEGNEARDLRTSGEGQGKRWMCGWADVDGSCDDDDDDDDDGE